MKRRFLIIPAILFLTSWTSCDSAAPTPDVQSVDSLAWRTTSALPATNVKHDDLYFVSASEGWFVTRTGSIYHTADGGTSWEEQFQSTAYLRSVGFATPLRGWVGNLEGDAGDVLYETRDGGTTWGVIDIGIGPLGICGIYVVDESTIYAVGRLRGPAYLLKSDDGGDTWVVKDMSQHAGMLIDVFFWNRLEGIAVGASEGELKNSSALVLRTTDGGHSWTTVHRTTRTPELSWKISFPVPDTGFVSVQSGLGTQFTDEYFLRTTDRGQSWGEKRFSSTPYSAQGIGFIDTRRGWIGSWYADRPTLVTEDGGESWRPDSFGQSLNRFRFINDSLGFASGNRIYKYSR